jgi:chromosome partitioning protein
VQRQLEAELEAAEIPRFQTSLAERMAYKAMFVERLTLAEMTDLKVGNLAAAFENVHLLANELLEVLEDINVRGVA